MKSSILGMWLGIILVLVVLAPLATIWSLNTLFPILNIPMGFDTWLASLILAGVVGGSTGVSFKK
jgi:hypothetical protein